MAIEIIEIISYAAGQSSLRGWPGERYIQAINYPGEFRISIKSVTQKRTNCFVIILTAAYITDYEEISISGTLGPEGPVDTPIINVLREWSTTLWSEDFQFEFIKGENLHNAMMEQLPIIQEAVDGYLKEEKIKEAVSGPTGDSGVLSLMNRDLIKILDPSWNPSG